MSHPRRPWQQKKMWSQTTQYQPREQMFTSNSHTAQYQAQEQMTVSAYERKSILDMHHMIIEWLEKFIEKAGYYPDWERRKQVHDSNIKRQDISNPEKAEKALSNKLITFVRSVGNTPSPFLREELKEKFYQWIDATGIHVGNCPKRLACFLLGTHEILEGKDEKIERDSENKKRDLNPDSYEYAEGLNKVFANIQAPLREERDMEISLKNKKWNEITIKNQFNGNAERGKIAFEQIVKNITFNDYQNFHFFPQREVQQIGMLGMVDMDLR
ncbi:hypothetical protein C1646_673018 [Rhizophagus diaphanus]|nr:hypothetical protein C1646_673018 [Rhizophagus diaphanus] [Rhizophagus sp. MUCL 43196]